MRIVCTEFGTGVVCTVASVGCGLNIDDLETVEVYHWLCQCEPGCFPFSLAWPVSLSFASVGGWARFVGLSWHRHWRCHRYSSAQTVQSFCIWIQYCQCVFWCTGPIQSWHTQGRVLQRPGMPFPSVVLSWSWGCIWGTQVSCLPLLLWVLMWSSRLTSLWMVMPRYFADVTLASVWLCILQSK